MSLSINFLGGIGDVGANSSYIYSDGTGLLIDTGLHPNKRDRDTFPHYEMITEMPCDLGLLTHAHTDHIGGLPYALKFFPHMRVMASRPTRDIAEYMLRDTVRLLRSEVMDHFEKDTLSLYTEQTLKKINLIIEGIKSGQTFSYRGRDGASDLSITLRSSGHILGSSSVFIETQGKRLLHTGDVNFRDQAILRGADLPRGHLDALIIESTNANEENLPLYEDETKRLGKYINEIADRNGSVLIPSFALGKTQEILRVVYSLMRRGSIPTMSIYTAGLARRISIIYDHYCYSEQMKHPGFEVSDIPQLPIHRNHFYRGDYFKEPSIVICTNGMMNKNTLSYKLARKWFTLPRFGIAIIGYQDPRTPGYAALNSEEGKAFDFGGKNILRKCSLERFRFTSHARIEDSLEYIEQTKPKLLFIVHGDESAGENLADRAMEISPQSRVILPEIGRDYPI
ncbi:MAG: MBL fold metallo-hydrolase [Candidatus Kapaibacterium sp.]